MAILYDLYFGDRLGQSDNFKFASSPTQTGVSIVDQVNTGEIADELNILRANETFTVNGKVWTYLGNSVGGSGNSGNNSDPEGIWASSTVNGVTQFVLLVPTGTPLSKTPYSVQSVDAATGWLVKEAEPLCFVGGTLIDTPAGERAVETLRIGDDILSADGRVVAVRWIGRQVAHPRVPSASPNANRLPVRVAANALGAGLPRRDLLLSADHALVVDGLLVNAGALVNGTTITTPDAQALPEQFTYYHIETEAHDEILAEGVPAETFIDYAGRRAFDNYQEYLDLYGCERIIPEMSRPRLSAARQLPRSLAQWLGIDDLGDSVVAETEALLKRLNAA